jgi:hypothetical protein
MRWLPLIYSVILSLILFCSFSFKTTTEPLKNGDLIFLSGTSGQGKAIQLATKSKYTHVGIIFIEDGKTMVYHAVEPVSKNTLKEFINLSEDGKYYIKRLKDQSLLTPEKIKKMLEEARSKVGKHYDLAFNWDDKEFYCSEYVWKLYEHALHISIGALRPLKDFDLSHPVVKEKLNERYGKNIPLDENMISPGDMYDSVLLE